LARRFSNGSSQNGIFDAMSVSHKPPSKFYVLAAIVIAVLIWIVMGTPDSDPASTPMAIARGSFGHR
jgi:hypothetical protein